VGKPVAAQPWSLAWRALVDLDGLAHEAQLELVADANPATLGERLRQRDLELSGDLGHEHSLALIKEIVKDGSLIQAPHQRILCSVVVVGPVPGGVVVRD
jgi:hypothetical protein